MADFYAVRCVDLVGPVMYGDQAIPVGQFLRAYDPTAHEGRGHVTWTEDLARALRFASVGEAYAFLTQVPTNRPVRPDGQPNRPITAFSVEVSRWVIPD